MIRPQLHKLYGGHHLLMILPLFLFACSAPIKTNIGETASYKAVIEAISIGEINTDPPKVESLPYDPTDVVILPPRFSKASVDGKIYFKQTSDKIIVIFKTWIGKGANFEGYMYTSSALSESDVHQDYYGDNVISIASLDVSLERKINNNWYFVSFRLD